MTSKAKVDYIREYFDRMTASDIDGIYCSVKMVIVVQHILSTIGHLPAVSVSFFRALIILSLAKK